MIFIRKRQHEGISGLSDKQLICDRLEVDDTDQRLTATERFPSDGQAASGYVERLNTLASKGWSEFSRVDWFAEVANQLERLLGETRQRLGLDLLVELAMQHRSDLLSAINALNRRRLEILPQIRELRYLLHNRRGENEISEQWLKNRIQQTIEIWADLEQEHTNLLFEIMWQDLGGEGWCSP
ncbi:MAG: hypothetical protein ACYTF1_22955 [Planctomycetota bacterium]|jgi:hypothetical protein